jgi:hypothetical protein
VEVFRCPLDESVTVVIPEKTDAEYKQVQEKFKEGNVAFTILGTEEKAIIVDGEALKEDWFTDDHLLVIMAHELGHLETNTENELAADQAGFDILVGSGASESAISLYAMEIQARYCVTQESLETHR